MKQGIILASLLVATPSVGQQKDLATALTSAKHVESWFPYLQAHANWCELITLAVIILGALPTVLALSSKNYMKTVVASIAAVIAILAGIKSVILQADKENYRSILVDAQEAVHTLYSDRDEFAELLKLNSEPLSDEESAVFQQKFKASSDQLVRLKERAKTLGIALFLPASNSKKTVAFFESNVVHAAQASKVLSTYSTPSAYMSVGSGACSTTFGAREYARYEARRLIANQIRPNVSPEELVGLMSAIDEDVRDLRGLVSRHPSSGLFIQRAEATLDRTRVPNSQLDLRSQKPSVLRWEGSSPVLPNQKGPLQVMTGAASREGRFGFLFEVTNVGNKLGVKLLEIQVFDDSSGGSTRWYFDVAVGDRRLFRIPINRYEDSQKPTRCQPSEAEGLSGSMVVFAGMNPSIRVTGYKPKDN